MSGSVEDIPCAVDNTVSTLETRIGHLSRVVDQNGLIFRRVATRGMSTEGATSSKSGKFDEKMLEHLVCPLSKNPLRYDAEQNLLISESIGVAYPIINGIPNLVPGDGHMLKTGEPVRPSKPFK